MKQFLLLFRNENNSGQKPSPEEMQTSMKYWMDWMGGIAAQDKLVDRGNRLEGSGKVVKPNHVITDGPYTEIKESIGGYTIIRAGSLEDAVALVDGCPILAIGGNVEVREIIEM